MPVGRLGHIVSLCVNRGWLRFDGLRAVNTVNSQPRSASGSDWDALVQRICALICSDVSHDGIILGDLKDRYERSTSLDVVKYSCLSFTRFYAEFGERIDHQRFSFRSLTDLVRAIPSVVVFYDTGARDCVVCVFFSRFDESVLCRRGCNVILQRAPTTSCARARPPSCRTFAIAFCKQHWRLVAAEFLTMCSREDFNRWVWMSGGRCLPTPI